MVKLFSDDPSDETRALQIWQILIGKAHNRQTITYGILADLLSFRGAGVMAQLLGHIMFYCQANDLPPLTVLVVNQDTGLAGEGLTSSPNLNADREKVFQYNWFNAFPPTPSELSDSYKRHKTS